MKVFVAGATGAVGRPLLRQLVAAGHQVTGTTRSPERFELIRSLGAEPVAMDGLDPEQVTAAVRAAAPEVVIHELTALSDLGSLKHFDRAFAQTNRLRTQGVDLLLAAARDAGARRFIAQSFTNWPNPRTGGPIKTEADGLDPDPIPATREGITALAHLERVTTGAEGIEGVALRYGGLYGPGTPLRPGGEMWEMVHKRRLPVIGGGGGYFSFVHVEDAAAATVLALDHGGPGVYNTVDDEPATAATWIPYLANLLGAKPPWSVPAWLVKPLVGDLVVAMMTQARGSSNAKARRELGFVPRYPSWRDGFGALAGAPAATRTG